MSDNVFRDLRTYIIVRNDLPSLTPGKAMAQVHHAGVQMMNFCAQSSLVKSYISDGNLGHANGFNTTIVLTGSLEQVKNIAIDLVPPGDLISGEILDPSYPFIVENMEIANLIPQDDSTKIVKVFDNGRVLMVRPEITCWWYLFDAVKYPNLMANFSLYP